jgi:hypothetical protein
MYKYKHKVKKARTLRYLCCWKKEKEKERKICIKENIIEIIFLFSFPRDSFHFFHPTMVFHHHNAFHFAIIHIIHYIISLFFFLNKRKQNKTLYNVFL